MQRQATEQITFSVGGMGCGGCAAGIEAILRETVGVCRAEVDFGRAMAKVEYDADATQPETLGALIRAAGYEVTRHP